MVNVLDENAELSLSHSKILIVDDQPINIQLIYNILSSEYTISAATNGDQAIEVCQNDPPDLVLLDVVMPNMSGIETCIILKQRLSTAEIPIIFITSCDEQDEENACWESGGVDFISKPINPMTLRNRVKAHLALKYQRDILNSLVYKDDLTAIFNRRYFDEHIIKVEKSANRDKIDAAVILIDIDHFKQFNKIYGHIRGDITLKEVADSIKEALMRPTDFVAYMGSALFAVVLPSTTPEGAIEVAIRIRRAVFACKIAHPDSKYKFITVSLGVSTVFLAQEKMVPLLDDAEQYLLQAKEIGRNICKYPKLG
ncbi:diguanylate cyclase [uncultured Psychrosphaera sp.]|jgi:diguanylate cyclase (GGDEF)-like protein|uniref:diguanylate cyclase n=1 Tax=uncultured Psychrosphaera sp. TaxID=1403522 RepID=UPI00260B420E|nr:diguanylate cyclase [uncultured Psychrosphaera sp.]